MPWPTGGRLPNFPERSRPVQTEALQTGLSCSRSEQLRPVCKRRGLGNSIDESSASAARPGLYKPRLRRAPTAPTVCKRLFALRLLSEEKLCTGCSLCEQGLAQSKTEQGQPKSKASILQNLALRIELFDRSASAQLRSVQPSVEQAAHAQLR